MAVNLGKARLRYCRINGNDIKPHVLCITVFETMCKPYITATIKLLDNNNAITLIPMNIGVPVNFAFDAGGKVYECKHNIIVPPSEGQQMEGMRALMYEITTASPAYLIDRANIVQRSDVNIPGTQVIQAIHNEFFGSDAPLQIVNQSLGMISKTTGGGHVIDNMKPFTAIQSIMKDLSYATTKTGSTIYFRAAENFVLGPLEDIFKQMGSQETFEQRATWGSEWHHMFTATNAIIEAQQIDNGKGGEGVTSYSSSKSIYDMTQGKDILSQFKAIASDASASFGRSGTMGSLSQFVKSGGGLQNVFQIDQRKREPSTEQVINKEAENAFQAAVRTATNFRIKVPLDTGINCTVGKGITCKLIPPLGDQNRGNNAYGGQMLCADVKHECWFDQRPLQATTTFRAVQMGRN